MENVRPLTSLSQDELIARIEQYEEVLHLRDAEIRELHAAIAAKDAEIKKLRHGLEFYGSKKHLSYFGEEGRKAGLIEDGSIARVALSKQEAV